ncbi:DUF4932 domain-containing protein [Capnocytophaga cynodegmi]|uniref:DUF4932 domain-containing protein n=1 Tax=Capnocytophaga cynodegmi TaxID=28189 RepID=UPI001AC69615|nr:DUF4932 domain-containing protein [Capnocytophaga cynodegmi]GIM54686.1 hypothetical protein CAPN005_13330 [Capnocytophaga cynodegmi]
MKRLFLLAVAFSFTIQILAQNESILAKPKVDKRVELLSIVFRLAEAQEYSAEYFKLYTDKINAYYEPYKNHELIQFVKKIRQERGIGYDAVMKMAVYLDENLKPITKFTDDIPESRWGKENSTQFVKLLKQFYKKSNSKKFFKDNEELYEEASKRFLDIYNLLDVDWYKKFYGKNPEEEFIIINGLGNGGGNYGISSHLPNQKKKVYAIMGAWSVDDSGMIVFLRKSNYLGTMIHEFCHSFVNYLLDQNLTPFQKNGEKIFELVKDKMEKQAYNNWQIMLNEALVRASVIKYAIDHNIPKENIQGMIQQEKKLGFVWIEDLLAELERYDKQRDIYPTLESYMPNLAKAYEVFAEKMHQYMSMNANSKM